jgi:hypothetical protein
MWQKINFNKGVTLFENIHTGSLWVMYKKHILLFQDQTFQTYQGLLTTLSNLDQNPRWKYLMRSMIWGKIAVSSNTKLFPNQKYFYNRWPSAYESWDYYLIFNLDVGVKTKDQTLFGISFQVSKMLCKFKLFSNVMFDFRYLMLWMT